MEVNQMQLLEIGLNALGFIAGGGILMVLASMFRRKGSKIVPADTIAAAPAKDMPTKPDSGSSAKGFEYIDLSGSNKDVTRPAKKSAELTRSRRNRAEVYDLARRMLNARKPVREISDELSMSRAEVSLLKARSMQDKGEQHV